MAIAVLLAAVGLSACAGSPKPAQSISVASSDVDACALLPAAALAEIQGGEVSVAKAMASGGWVAGQCEFHSPTSGFIVSIGTAVSFQAFGDPAAPNAKAKLAIFKQKVTTLGSARDVAGIGDGAVLGTTGIAAYAGGTYVEILRLSLTDKQLVQIATKIVANL